MDIYSGFAYAYDFLMKDVDYDKWVELIEEFIFEYAKGKKTVLELACGTGNLTERLFVKGYDIIGTDISEDMLMIAQEKAYNNNHMIKFLNQDMRNISFKKKVDIVISFCDGLNYIVNLDELENVFKGVHNILNDNGLFIFDISSKFKLENIISNNTFAESYENIAYIWENFYNKESNILNFDLTIFIKNDEGTFERYFENHIQRAYGVEELKKIALKIGFDLLEVRDSSGKELSETSDRIVFVCKKR